VRSSANRCVMGITLKSLECFDCSNGMQSPAGKESQTAAPLVTTSFFVAEPGRHLIARLYGIAHKRCRHRDAPTYDSAPTWSPRLPDAAL
jgi:hypothetical protein